MYIYILVDIHTCICICIYPRLQIDHFTKIRTTKRATEMRFI